MEPRIRAAWKRLLLAVLTFAVIAAPLVAALSMNYGHPTFGETGKFNYWWFVNEVESQDHGTLWVRWQGDPPGSGVPIHPTRRVLEDPDVFEFGSPIVATYPPWYDPTYWNEGAAAQIDVRRQAANLARNVRTLASTLVVDHFFLLTVPAMMILLVTSRNGRIAVASIVYFKSLWIVGVGIVGLYLLLVFHTRYVAAVFPLLVMLLVATVRVRTPDCARVVGALLVGLSVLGVALQCGPRLARAAATIVSSNGDVRDERWIVAEEFTRVGVKPETPVAAIDQQDDDGLWPQAILCDWARLARVRVVGEVRNTRDERSQFWRLSSDRQNEALQALRRTGARIAVATGVPVWADTTGWVSSSSYDDTS